MTDPASVSAVRRREVIDALRRGTVPQSGLDLFAVGLDRFAAALDDDLATVTRGGAAFHAVRGDYGSGKTFFARWLAERAKRAGLATAEVQISETETPLHRLETVYRRLTERLATATHQPSALRAVVDSWFYTLEEEVLDGSEIDEDDEEALAGAVDALMERRLADVARTTPAFAAALRGYRRAVIAGDGATAEALIAWLGGQKSVAASARRAAGVRGDLDHFAALGFLQGLLTVLRDCGHPGLLLVLDETETLQRVRGDVREKGLNALRQLLDEIDAGRFPGLFLLITGTPAFYDGQQGVQRLPPLAQRLATDFTTDARFDSPAPSSSACPASTSRAWGNSAGKRGTSTGARPAIPSVSPPGSTTPTSANSPPPSPEGWAATSASPPRLPAQARRRRPRPCRRVRGLRPAQALPAHHLGRRADRHRT